MYNQYSYPRSLRGRILMQHKEIWLEQQIYLEKKEKMADSNFILFYLKTLQTLKLLMGNNIKKVYFDISEFNNIQ